MGGKLVLFVIVISATLAVWQQKTKSDAEKAATSGNDIAELKAIENKWNDALLRADVGYFESVTAPEWSHIDENAMMQTRAQILDSIKSGKTKYETSTLTDMKVRVYGNSAVVTASFTEKGTASGKTFQDSGMFTDTFVKRNGNWMSVATHISLKPDKPSDH